MIRLQQDHSSHICTALQRVCVWGQIFLRTHIVPIKFTALKVCVLSPVNQWCVCVYLSHLGFSSKLTGQKESPLAVALTYSHIHIF